MAFQWYSSQSTDKTEQYHYTVVKKFKHFEIRQYEPALFSTITMAEQPYRTAASNGFRVLAGYIFGGNQNGEKIAMTSPVSMQMSDSMRMSFMVPRGYSKDDLPKPNDDRIQFEEQPARIVAAIQFGGWADDEKITHYKDKLLQYMQEEGLTAIGPYNFLGYNPPYEVINRRNEIIIEVDYPKGAS